MSERLLGKVAVVTGGASGLGAGIVRRFVEEGARVIVEKPFGRDLASAQSLNDTLLGSFDDVAIKPLVPAFLGTEHLVRRALGFIRCARCGLTRPELEDVPGHGLATSAAGGDLCPGLQLLEGTHACLGGLPEVAIPDAVTQTDVHDRRVPWWGSLRISINANHSHLQQGERDQELMLRTGSELATMMPVERSGIVQGRSRACPARPRVGHPKEFPDEP